MYMYVCSMYYMCTYMVFLPQVMATTMKWRRILLAKLEKKILSSFGHQLHSISSGIHIRYGYELNMTSLCNNSSPQRQYYVPTYAMYNTYVCKCTYIGTYVHIKLFSFAYSNVDSSQISMQHTDNGMYHLVMLPCFVFSQAYTYNYPQTKLLFGVSYHDIK